jgi:hypothetical protein
LRISPSPGRRLRRTPNPAGRAESAQETWTDSVAGASSAGARLPWTRAVASDAAGAGGGSTVTSAARSSVPWKGNVNGAVTM